MVAGEGWFAGRAGVSIAVSNNGSGFTSGATSGSTLSTSKPFRIRAGADPYGFGKNAVAMDGRAFLLTALAVRLGPIVGALATVLAGALDPTDFDLAAVFFDVGFAGPTSTAAVSSATSSERSAINGSSLVHMPCRAGRRPVWVSGVISRVMLKMLIVCFFCLQTGPCSG